MRDERVSRKASTDPAAIALCIVGPLPPPMHGMAGVNAHLVNSLEGRLPLTVLNTAPTVGKRGAVYHLTKTARSIRIPFRLAAARLQGRCTYYGSVDDGLGGIWTTSFALLARLLGFRIVLHHHSFRYLLDHSRLMAALTIAAGTKATHIVLCENMAERLGSLYPVAQRIRIVPNSIPEPPFMARDRLEKGSITVGLLSNLMFEKGLKEFVDTVAAAAAQGIDVRGVLAGPAPNAETETFLREALNRHGDILEWQGPVSGDRKEAFFRSIDLFLFPTRYRTEAYPLVLIEALCRGVPIIANDRGCIGSLALLDTATIVAVGEDFTARAIDRMEALATLSDSERLTLRQTVHQHGMMLNRQNAAAWQALIEYLVHAYDKFPKRRSGALV